MEQQQQRLHICGEDRNGVKICLIFTPGKEYRITFSDQKKNRFYQNPAEAFRYFLGFTEVDSRLAVSGEEGTECFFHRKRLHTYGEDRKGDRYCVREVFTPHPGYRVTSRELGSRYFFEYFYDKEANALRYFRALAQHVSSRCEIDEINGEECPVCS